MTIKARHIISVLFKWTIKQDYKEKKKLVTGHWSQSTNQLKKLELRCTSVL